MTIADMRKYLEYKGFIVDITGAGPNCEFTIRRGRDAHTKILYDACIGTDRNELTLRRGKFLDDILAEFDMLHPDRRQRLLMPSIKNVIFNDPATIVFWTDGSKTIVKAQDGDIFDPEKGLAMAISKKALGNKGNYCNELKKWLPKEYLCMYCGAETTNDSKVPDFSGLKAACDGINNLAKTLKEKRKKSAVQKAYDILVNWRDGKVPVSKEISENMDKIEELIGYLGEALDD